MSKDVTFAEYQAKKKRVFDYLGRTEQPGESICYGIPCLSCPFNLKGSCNLSLELNDPEKAISLIMNYEIPVKGELIVKLEGEQDSFRKHLLSLSPEDILRGSPEYWIREDIIRVLREEDFSEETYKFLLEKKGVLTFLSRSVEGFSSEEYMEAISALIEDFARLFR